MRNIGFAVEGENLRYVTGFTRNVNCNNQAVGMPTEVKTRTQTNSTGVTATGMQTWAIRTGTTRLATVGSPLSATIFSGSICDLDVFTALSLGDPKNKPAALSASSDTWTIDQNKV